MNYYIVFSIKPYLKKYESQLTLGEAFDFEFDEIIKLIIELFTYSFYEDIYQYEMDQLEDFCYYMWGECDEHFVFINTIDLMIKEMHRDLRMHLKSPQLSIAYIMFNDIILRNKT